VAGVLTGDWARAWSGVKNVVKGVVGAVIGAVKEITAPVRAVAETVFKVFKGAFQSIKGAATGMLDAALGAVTMVLDGVAKGADLMSKLPGPIGDAWDKIQTAAEDAADSINRTRERIRGANQDVRESARGTGQTVSAVMGGISRDTDKHFKEAERKAKEHSGNLRRGVVQNVGNMAEGVRGGLQNVVNNTNKALKGFGVKKSTYVAFEAERANLPQGNQRGGIIHARKGILVPGKGNGDKVPAMLEPGEVVINKRAVASMGGARRVNRINRMVPRFATGGVAEPPGDPGSEVVQAAYAGEVGAFLRKFNMDLTQGYNPGGPSVSPGHLSLGAAPSLDVVPLGGDWDGLFAQGLKWALSQGMQVGYDGQYGTQSWPDHGEGNHAHIDWKSGGKLGAAVAKIKNMVLKGPAGPLLEAGQAALDKSVAGANEMLSKIAPAIDTAGIGTYSGPLDRVFPATSLASPGVQLSPTQVQSVMRPAGLPSVFLGISADESGHHPGIIGYDPGGTRGLGLWQITTGFNDDIIRQFGGEAQMRNPVRNALAAKAIFDRQPGAWAASGNALQQGGIVQKMQGGGVVGHGGEDPHTPLGEWFGQMYDQPLVGRMKEIVGNINVNSERFTNMSTSYGKALDYSELATVAMAGDHETPDGVMTWGTIEGRTAVGGLGSDLGQGWLDMQLVELLQLRDRMLTAIPIVKALTQFVKDKIKALTGPKGFASEAARIHREAERVYNRLKSDVESLQQQIAALEKIQKPTEEQQQRLRDKRALLHDTVNQLGVAKQKLDDAKFRVGAVSDVAGSFTDKQSGLGAVLTSLQTGGAEDGSWPSLETLQGRTGKAGEIFDVQTEIGAALRSFGESTASIPDTAAAAEAVANPAQEIQDQIDRDWQRMYAVSQAQLPVFNRWMGVAHSGMVLPGTASDTYNIRAQGGEVISKPGSGTNIVVYLGDREVTDIVGVEIDGKLQKVAQRATPAGGVAGRRAAYK
jgi:methyl-accepting chemotaxis protein